MLMQELQQRVASWEARRAAVEARVQTSRTLIAYSRMLLARPVWTVADVRNPPPKRPTTSLAASGDRQGNADQ